MSPCEVDDNCNWSEMCYFGAMAVAMSFVFMELNFPTSISTKWLKILQSLWGFKSCLILEDFKFQLSTVTMFNGINTLFTSKSLHGLCLKRIEPTNENPVHSTTRYDAQVLGRQALQCNCYKFAGQQHKTGNGKHCQHNSLQLWDYCPDPSNDK